MFRLKAGQERLGKEVRTCESSLEGLDVNLQKWQEVLTPTCVHSCRPRAAADQSYSGWSAVSSRLVYIVLFRGTCLGVAPSEDVTIRRGSLADVGARSAIETIHAPVGGRAAQVVVAFVAVQDVNTGVAVQDVVAVPTV